MVPNRSGANSATGRANRQASLHRLGMFRRSIRFVRRPGAFGIGTSSQKPGKCGMPEPGGDRPHPATDGGSPSFRIGGHDRQNETSWKHVQTKAQSGTRALDVNQARSGSSETRSWLAGLFPADGPPHAGSARSEGASLGVGRIGQLLRPGLQVTPEQHRGKHDEHCDDADGDEEGIGWHAAALL